MSLNVKVRKRLKVLIKSIDKRYDDIEAREMPRDEDDWWELRESYRDLIDRIQNDLEILKDAWISKKSIWVFQGK